VVTVKLKIILFSMLLFLVGNNCAAYAFAYCLDPSVPSCLNSSLDWDELAFYMCKSALEKYKSELEQSAKCHADAAWNDASDSYSEALKKFNCKARQEIYCR